MKKWQKLAMMYFKNYFKKKNMNSIENILLYTIFVNLLLRVEWKKIAKNVIKRQRVKGRWPKGLLKLLPFTRGSVGIWLQ
jgi:hypothetical protein